MTPHFRKIELHIRYFGTPVAIVTPVNEDDTAPKCNCANTMHSS